MTAPSFELFPSLGKVWPVSGEGGNGMSDVDEHTGAQSQRAPAGGSQFYPGGSDIYAEPCMVRARW